MIGKTVTYKYFSEYKSAKNDIANVTSVFQVYELFAVYVLCRAALHAVQLPAVLVFPSWRTHGHPSALPVPSSAPQLVADVSAALLHPMVIKLLPLQPQPFVTVLKTFRGT